MHLMLSSLSKSYLAHAVEKLSCVGVTKPFNQPTSQPLPLSAASNVDAAHAGEPHYPLLGKIEDPNKNSSLSCGGYMPEAGSSWATTGLISQAAEGKRFVLAAQWSHSTPPPV